MTWKTNPLPPGYQPIADGIKNPFVIPPPPAPKNPPPAIKPAIEGGDAGPKVAEYLIDRIRELESALEESEAARAWAEQIGFAKDSQIKEFEEILEEERHNSEQLDRALNIVFEIAHRESTGPVVPDTLWQIREIIKDFI